MSARALGPEAIRQAVGALATGPALAWPPRAAGSVKAPRAAAVLVPVLVPEERNAPLELLFLVRPEDSSSHAGQVAFPGGVAEEGDDGPEATALREAEEELGIGRTEPEVVGMLPAFPTHTGFLVRPVVGLLRGSIGLTPSPREVAATFRVALPDLMVRSNRRVMRSRWGPGLPEYPLWFWPFTPSPIWGATGHILATLLARLDAGP